MATSVNGCPRGRPHYLVVSFPAQGHINPALQLAKRLIHHGARVTYATAVSALRRMGEPPAAEGLSFKWFSDGFDEGVKSLEEQKMYMSELKRCGSDAVRDMIRANLEEESAAEAITGVIYSVLVPWVSRVAREFELPATLVWIEPATVLDIYWYYFNACHKHVFESDPIRLPKLAAFSRGDLPSFLQPSKTFPSAVANLKEHMEALEWETSPKILVNTFAALEADALTSVEKLKMIPIGPLVSSSAGRADLFRSSDEDYIKWLDSKVDKSVIYISLGTQADDLPESHMEALTRGVLATGRPFLWILRAKKAQEKSHFLDLISGDGRGLVLGWCSQTAVLAHPSVGCFVTHCGWNSTLESLESGVPMVALPQFADQWTTAKLVEDTWRIGVRVTEGNVDAAEVRRCLDKVMSDTEDAQDMRRNAARWKKLALDAAAEGGPSDLNLKAFVEQRMGEEAYRQGGCELTNELWNHVLLW